MEILQIVLYIGGALLYFWLQTRSQRQSNKPAEVVSPYPPVVVQKEDALPPPPKKPKLTIDEVLEEYAITEVKKNSSPTEIQSNPNIEPEEIKVLQPKEIRPTKIELENTDKAKAYEKAVRKPNKIVDGLTDPKTLMKALIAKEILERPDFDKKFRDL